MKNQMNVISKRVNLIVESTSRTITNMLSKKLVGNNITIVDKHKGELTGICHRVTKATFVKDDIRIIMIILHDGRPVITNVLLSEIKYD